MYKFYLDGVLLPVTPGAITMKYGDKDETIDLMDGGVFTVINPPGLTEFEFEFLLPATKLPFAQYDGAFREPQYYLNHIEDLKTSCEPFQFIMVRSSDRTMKNLNAYADTNIKVTLADCKVSENAGESGRGRKVSVTLRQYRSYATKKVSISDGDGGSTVTIDDSIPRYAIVKEGTYISKKGETLQSIAYDFMGDEKYAEALAAVQNPTLEFTLDPLPEFTVLQIDKATIQKKYDAMHVSPTETVLWENSLYINGVQDNKITRSDYELYLQMIEPFAEVKKDYRKFMGGTNLIDMITGHKVPLDFSQQPPLIQFAMVLDEMLDSLKEVEDTQIETLKSDIEKLSEQINSVNAVIAENKTKLETFEKEAETELTESLQMSIEVTKDLIAAYEKTLATLKQEQGQLYARLQLGDAHPANAVTLEMSTDLNNNLTTALANIKSDITSASVHTSWAFEIGLIKKEGN